MIAYSFFSASFCPSESSLGIKQGVSWHHTAFRVSKPVVSIEFYKKHFGMSLIYQVDYSNNVTIYYLATLRQGQQEPNPNTTEGERFFTHFDGTLLALSHEKGLPASMKMNNGNEEPYRGFGHIAFNCNDVYRSSEELEANGVTFRKRPDEGRMKGLAFALDPDGYWIEIVGRGQSPMPEAFNLSQTMIRVKDPTASVSFYRDILGMTVVREMHMSDFSNYFLASLHPSVKPPIEADHTDAKHFVHTIWNPCLELTHNHGTEKDDDFHYHTGNTDPVGFSHIGYLVNNVKMFYDSQKMQRNQHGIKLEEGHIVTMTDPDGYCIKLFERGVPFK